MNSLERDILKIANTTYWAGLKVGLIFSFAVVMIIAVCVYVIGAFT